MEIIALIFVLFVVSSFFSSNGDNNPQAGDSAGWTVRWCTEYQSFSLVPMMWYQFEGTDSSCSDEVYPDQGGGLWINSGMCGDHAERILEKFGQELHEGVVRLNYPVEDSMYTLQKFEGILASKIDVEEGYIDYEDREVFPPGEKFSILEFVNRNFRDES